MATLLLQAAGSYLGSFFGAAGSTIGAAVGAYGGYLLDQSLINSTRRIQGQRLSSAQMLTGEDGAPLARVYGTVRQGGTLIWATRFEEASKTERQGGKGGGPKVTSYTYFANFAVAICEGEIAHVRRVWADGKELDLTEHTIRIYRGSADQLPDPLIVAKQGIGNTPAYRGTAYAVFDRFALANFGNRIPQIQFEVMRTIGGISSDIEAITIIPGSTEFGLSPTAISQVVRPGETIYANRHVLNAGSDWEASIDELQALCPNLKQVALVVSWFGDDLRAGNCQIRPRVSNGSGYQNDTWQVAGLTRAAAGPVSQYNGKAAFGGTPDDRSVVAAIQDLRARGLKVMLYPFVLMDIPAGNILPSPYGGASQAAYPWRGEITCSPAPGVVGSVDGTATAASQVSAFSGNATPAMFGVTGNAVAYVGASDWGYRRFILHYAKLAELAGGVDALLIGSEFKALTRVRGASGFPFVSVLSGLATDVRSMLGSAVKLTYAADWSEYSAYTPPGTNSLHFHLDPLWANPAINAVGIDNYMPLSDWRDEDWDGNNPDGASSPSDFDALKQALNAGEGYDWYYANAADRQARVRTPIADGLAGKDWVYRFKDLRGWWENAHYERISGVENTTPTAWVPQGKPIWFTELGCPAIDKAANQPNVFPDVKSSAAAIPYFSNAGRDDEAQIRFLSAHFAHWKEPSNNPVSTVYAGPMIDLEHTYLWAWDARPFPTFPLSAQTWSDGDNYLTGHWLNGRLSQMALQDLVAAIFDEHGIEDYDLSGVDGVLAGYLMDRPGTARDALDTLLAFYRVDVSENAGGLKLRSRDRALPKARLVSGLALGRNDETVEEKIEANSDLVQELALEYRDALRDHQQASAVSRIGSGSNSTQSIALPAVVDGAEALAQLRQFHRQQSAARKSISFQTGWSEAALQPGDLIALEDGGETYRITKIVDTEQRRFDAEIALPIAPMVRRSRLTLQNDAASMVAGAPLSVFLDLPLLPEGSAMVGGLRIAVWSKPWSPVAALASAGDEAYAQKLTLDEPAIIGSLMTDLAARGAGRFSTNDFVEVELTQGGLSSVSDLALLNGANAAAVMSASGAWEVLQFGTATEVSPGRWRLERLLRGQLGTLNAMEAGAVSGAKFVLLDASVKACSLGETQASIVLNWKVGPLNKAVSDRHYTSQQVAPATRSSLANAPVHFKAKRRESGDIAFVWKRCGSLNADSWEVPEIPLTQTFEGYRIRVLGAGNSVKRAISVASGQWTYALADRQADFGGGPSAAVIEVSQISNNGLPGLPRTLNLTF
ncbi:MAG: baseplate multidomain protein megatron [Rhizobiaceae bacterium]